ncbi:MAG: type II secretion system protein N [Pseudomonadota bacterium]
MIRPFRLVLLLVLLFGLALLIAFLPMRLALEWSNLGERGLAARDIQGSIWSGRLIDTRFRDIPLGTFDAALQPASLLATPMVAVTRPEGLTSTAGEQPFAAMLGGGTGHLVVREANGDIPLDRIAGRLPLSAARLSNISVDLDEGRCQSASGEVQLVLSSWVGRFAAQNGLRGTLKCDGDALMVRGAGQSGLETLSFRVEPDGRYRAELAIEGLSEELAFGLRGLGFRRSGNAMVLGTKGLLR